MASHGREYPSKSAAFRRTGGTKVARGMNDVVPRATRTGQNGNSTRLSFQRNTADLGPMRSTVTPGAAASPSRTTWPLIMTKRLLALSE